MAKHKTRLHGAAEPPSQNADASDPMRKTPSPQKDGKPKSLPELVETVREELRQLTGLKLCTTVKTSKMEGGWRISVEMLEKTSIPDSMDLLATYEALVDPNGHVMEFQRKGMRKRMEAEVENEA